MTTQERQKCIGCGLPTLVDDYSTCSACHDQADQQAGLKPYDNYEISPCKRHEEPDSPGKFYFEVCEPHEADVWTLYGHINGEGVQAIGDFTTLQHAEETYQRITGIPFPASYQSGDRLRLMHAAPKLLAALLDALPYVEDVISNPEQLACFKRGVVQGHAKAIRAAIAAATERPL